MRNKKAKMLFRSALFTNKDIDRKYLQINKKEIKLPIFDVDENGVQILKTELIVYSHTNVLQKCHHKVYKAFKKMYKKGMKNA